jgi:tetratricopeptide (TPR) repeat protein
MNSETSVRGTHNIAERIESLEITFFTQFTKVQADINRQFEFIQNKLNSPTASAVTEGTLISFVKNIMDSTESAKSVVEEVRSVHSQSAPSQLGLDDMVEVALPPPSPREVLRRTFSISTSVADAVYSLNNEPQENVALWVITAFRKKAVKKLEEQNYADARVILQTVLQKSEQKYGNLYEWKDETIRMLAIAQCRLHRWDEVEEIINSPEPFNGRHEVLRILAREYCAEDKVDEARRILKDDFEGRDDTVAEIIDDLCKKRKWEHAVKFANLNFVGREGHLETVAVGCQQSGRWQDAAEILREVLTCKISRNAPTADTLHALANAHFHLNDYISATEWCDEAIAARHQSVGQEHVLFYHTINLAAQIRRAQDDTDVDVEGLRLLIESKMIVEGKSIHVVRES